METAYLSAYAFQRDWPLDHSKLRQDVVAYLRRFQTQFKDWFDNRFRSFDLSHLARESSYGDDLCVQASAHLVIRAIHVLTDMEDSEWSWNLEGAGLNCQTGA